jgi:phosphomannomutase/phosphoglucomutase
MKCADSDRPIGTSGLKLRQLLTIDGVRAIFDDGWGLIRASNTQPALVLRFEAVSPAQLAVIRAAIETELETARRQLTV